MSLVDIKLKEDFVNLLRNLKSFYGLALILFSRVIVYLCDVEVDCVGNFILRSGKQTRYHQGSKLTLKIDCQVQEGAVASFFK